MTSIRIALISTVALSLATLTATLAGGRTPSAVVVTIPEVTVEGARPVTIEAEPSERPAVTPLGAYRIRSAHKGRVQATRATSRGQVVWTKLEQGGRSVEGEWVRRVN